MSDDSFIREVEEELRSERLRSFWDRFGRIVIAGAVLVVLVVAGVRLYEWYTATQRAEAGDAFMNAVRLAEDGKRDEAVAALRDLEGDATPVYAALAKLRAAAELAREGKTDEAVAAYDLVAADGALDENFRAIASLRAGLLLVDTGTPADVESRVSRLSGPTAPYRASAREALGLAYFKANDMDKAFAQFDAIQTDDRVSQPLRQRARIMLDLIAARGGPVQAAQPAVEVTPAPTPSE